MSLYNYKFLDEKISWPVSYCLDVCMHCFISWTNEVGSIKILNYLGIAVPHFISFKYFTRKEGGKI